ncbi:MAG: hypothetical protein EBQ66_02670 [Flavobacteriia bacterium]|nr:hypothetical protein [Flavobacteriia bacterium]
MLEIGPNIGQQTYCIMNNNPRFVTQVEADEDNLPNLRSRFPHNNILHQDIFDYYKVPHKMDVVVCCGMFYHLHNPFHLLELIVNQSDPEYLVLDCTSADNASGWLKDSISLEDPTTGECKIRVRDEYTSAVLIDTEVTNTPGMRQSSMKKHMPFSIVFHTDLYRKALESFGYQTLKIEKIGTRFKTKTKHSSWMGLWKKT